MAKTKRSKLSLYFIYPSVFFIFIAFSFFYLLSARGYTFHLGLDGISFEKTGMLVVSSKPSDAEILLNGKSFKKKTVPFFSTKVDRLRSGSYEITIRKKDYIDWKKNINIYPEEVTWANYLLLFQKNPEIQKLNIEGVRADILGSNDGKFSVIASNSSGIEKIHLLNHASGELTLVKNLSEVDELLRPKNIRFLNWTQDRKIVLIEGTLNNKSEKFYLDLDTRELEPLVSDQSIVFDKIAADTSGGHNVFVLTKGEIKKYDIRTKIYSEALDTKVVYLTSQNGKLFYIKEEAQNRSLIQMNSDGSSKTTIFDSIPVADDYELNVSAKNQRMSLVIGNSKVLYILDKNKNRFTLEKVDENVTLAKWSQDGEKIMYSDANSVFVSDFYTKKDYILGPSGGLSHMIWYDQNHILGTKKGLPIVMEYDGKNIVELSNQKDVNVVFYSSDNRNIYFASSKEQNEINSKIFLYKVKF